MIRKALIGLSLLALSGCASTQESDNTQAPTRQKESGMELGNFSVSLAVKDLVASRAFYEKLGFHVIGGDGQRYLILQNATSTIGIFQGLFEDNILTFNPGWDRNSQTLDGFDDVREIQKQLKARGVGMVIEADESSTGPASFIIVDPDGNQILVDQHVPKPE